MASSCEVTDFYYVDTALKFTGHFALSLSQFSGICQTDGISNVSLCPSTDTRVYLVFLEYVELFNQV